MDFLHKRLIIWKLSPCPKMTVILTYSLHDEMVSETNLGQVLKSVAVRIKRKQGPSSLTIFSSQFGCKKFHSALIQVVMNRSQHLCTWNDSCTVVSCAKICRDIMARNGIIIHQIWIVMESRWDGPLIMSLRWRHNGHDCVSNHQHHYCLLNRLIGRRSK